MHVPPWQMVSSLLGGEPLRVASWWQDPEIPSTTATTAISCWDAALSTKTGAVQIATTGTWQGTTIGLKGGASPAGNHAKIRVSTGTHPYAIFGDMNQQGSLTTCTRVRMRAVGCSLSSKISNSMTACATSSRARVRRSNSHCAISPTCTIPMSVYISNSSNPSYPVRAPQG